MISAISGSILGSATSSWFEKTAMGRWFYKKMDNIYNWAADRYGLEVLKSEDKWRKKYPNIANKMDDLERRLHKLENGQKTDKPKRQINMRVKPLTRTK
tara:strand:- start:785 stop:1081 length:297 start_codon:yes stop_codon:yes gene_type:complete